MTHTAKHTPGPWVVTEHSSGMICVAGPDNKDLCAVGYNRTDGRDDAANAHMIAAAPAMYEALIEAEGMWNIARMIDSKHHAGNPISNELWSDFHQYIMEWHAKRKTALAQAEGR